MAGAGEVPWGKRTVEQLRRELAARGLPIKGKKAELVAALEPRAK